MTLHLRVCVFVFCYFSLRLYFFLVLPFSFSFSLCPLRLWKLSRTWVYPLHAPLLLSPCVIVKPSLCRPLRYISTSPHMHANSHFNCGCHPARWCEVSIKRVVMISCIPSLWSLQEVHHIKLITEELCEHELSVHFSNYQSAHKIILYYIINFKYASRLHDIGNKTSHC